MEKSLKEQLSIIIKLEYEMCKRHIKESNDMTKAKILIHRKINNKVKKECYLTK